MIQQQDQADPIKFEVHMYHPKAIANAVTPTSWFYTLYVHTQSSIVHFIEPYTHKILHFPYKMFFTHTCKNSLNSMKTKTHHFIVLLTCKN